MTSPEDKPILEAIPMQAAPMQMPVRVGPPGQTGPQRPAPIGVELFVQATRPTDVCPATLFDAAWAITWTNVPAVLSDVAKALKSWGVTEPKPIVLRYERSKINPDMVAMLMDYIVLNVRNAGLESVIEVAPKPAEVERLPDGVGSK